MDRRYRAIQPKALLDLAQCQVRLLRHQCLHLLARLWQKPRLAPGKPVPRLDLPGPASLDQELLDHSLRNPETLRHLLLRPLAFVIGFHNPTPQIQGDRLHPHTLLDPSYYSYSFI